MAWLVICSCYRSGCDIKFHSFFTLSHKCSYSKVALFGKSFIMLMLYRTGNIG